MKILIIEDEPHAAKLLESLLRELLPDSTVVGRIDTVKKAVQYFQQNALPDLAMMDIQLADGISFNIFDQCEVKCPVIFTTAYDEYALKAFKVNSIDYILKPIDKDELRQSLEKFRNLRGSSAFGKEVLQENLQEVMRMLTKKYKGRFMIKVGEHLRTVDVGNIFYFVSQEKTTFCCTTDNRRMILDHTLEELEDLIDPEIFFRINRKYLVSAAAISDIVQFTNSRLKLILKNCADQDVIVAREKVQEFKAWLDR